MYKRKHDFIIIVKLNVISYSHNEHDGITFNRKIDCRQMNMKPGLSQ